MNSAGSSGASKDSDLDGEWLPDLDSSSGESDLESCDLIYTQRLFVIATCLHCTSADLYRQVRSIACCQYYNYIHHTKYACVHMRVCTCLCAHACVHMQACLCVGASGAVLWFNQVRNYIF